VEPALAAVPGDLEVLATGYLPLEQLAGVLGGADVVAYPSLGEGFGLPVLEAMACGAAVLTTPLLAIPEVGGDAVEYVESTPEGIEAGLIDLLTSPARCAELSAAAAERAAAFTWAASAEAHLRTFARAIAG
jgi:glycosyltransferase involved in cell wall biosynthesis